MASFSEATEKEIRQVAANSDIEPATLLAICEVESGGRAFAVVEGRKEPLIRFEGHYFDRLVPGAARRKARASGLAHPRAGKVKNPRSQSARWTMLKKARAIDDDAALQSCSWGIGQVMGAHWKALGFTSPQALVREARAGVGGQVRLMVRFIETNGLLPYLKRRDWAGFAARYNGPAFRKNRYDEKVAAAYARHQVRNGERRAGTAPFILRRGSRGARVRDLQLRLTAAGYPLATDGIFGSKTETAVKLFQRQSGLEVDGIFGAATRKTLDTLLIGRAKGWQWIATLINQLHRWMRIFRTSTRLWR